MSEKIQAVLAANPNTSWNDLVFTRLSAAVGTRNGALSDLWMRWFAQQGFATGTLDERRRAWEAFRNVPQENRTLFMLPWAVFFRVTVPDATAAPTATAGVLSADVSFVPPAFDGNSPITGYRVTATPGGITATGVGSPITVPGLTAATPYTFTVAAQNAAGFGPESPASNSVTPT